MQKFHIKSILLGIGIGIVLTAFISIIYSAGNNQTMSREDIVEKAKQYGMVFREDNVLIKSIEDEAKKDNTIEENIN